MPTGNCATDANLECSEEKKKQKKEVSSWKTAEKFEMVLIKKYLAALLQTLAEELRVFIQILAACLCF